MKKATSLFLLLSVPLLVWSQSMISGKIIGQKSKEALVGVNILLDSGQGTTTDFNGNYSLKLPENSAAPIELEISYIGYLKQTLTIENTSADQTLNFSLQPDAYQLKDIVVSANKKNQSALQVPMSISTLTPLQIKRTGAVEFRDFASGVPNLAFDSQGGGYFGRSDNGISIRGIAGESTTSMYLDETPLPENISPRLLDVAGVEILKGPQGTLYGSRNMGGAVKILTNQPNVHQVEGSVQTSVAKVKEGDFDYHVEGVFNIPLNDKMAFRGAAYYDFQSGVFDRVINPNANIINKNRTTVLFLEDDTPFPINLDKCPGCNLENVENIDDEINTGFHASLGFYPTDKISIIPKVIVQQQRGSGLDYAEEYIGNFQQTRISGVPENFEDSWKHYSLSASIDLGIGQLISSTSYLDRYIFEMDDDGESFSRYFEIYDGEENLDFFAGNISKENNNYQFNQEIRFESHLDGPFDFTVGAFYMRDNEQEKWLSGSLGAGSYISLYYYEDPEFASYIEEEAPDFYDFGGIYDGEELAFFGEAYYSFFDKLRVTLGLRYFDATRSIDSYETGFLVDDEYLEIVGQVTESGIIPKVNIAYQINKNQLLYATVGKGYRLGDANEIVPEIFCEDDLAELPDGTHPRTYESDFLWNYEVGFKGSWAEGKFTTNAALFYNDWQNLQQNRNLECGYNFVSNVGAASTTGGELEIKSKVTKNLELGIGVGYVLATIDEAGADLEAEVGDKILFTPNLTGNAFAQYSGQLGSKNSWYVLANVQHVGERLNTFTPEDPEEAHKIFAPYTIVNARAGLQFANYEFSLFAQNLTNTAANFGDILSIALDIPGRPRFATNRPITIGLQAKVYF